MTKIKISGLSNYGNETYIRFKVDEYIIRRLNPFLCKLVGDVWDFNYDEASYNNAKLTEKKFFDPKFWIDHHLYYTNKGFEIHVIIGKNNIHLLIKHNKKGKQKLIKTIEEQCKWIKPKKIKNKKPKHAVNKK